jgi:molybdate transport system permease protein
MPVTTFYVPLFLSLRLAAITTVILLAIGIPIAYWIAFSRWRLKPVIEAVIALPLVLPPPVLGFYLLLAMGSRGWLGRLWDSLFDMPLAFSFSGLLIASVCYSLPFTVQPLQAAFAGLNPRLLEASWTLGASRTVTFFKVIWPNSLPGVLAAAVLTFTHTLGEFGVVLMVGGNIPGQTRTVSIAIYDLVEALHYDRAGTMALTLLALSYFVLLAFYVTNTRTFQLWRHT